MADDTQGRHYGVDDSLARHGGLSYLEIPAVDAGQSANFYAKVLSWKTERRGGDDFRFDDATGHLIGRWVTGRVIAREPGLVPYFYVDHIDVAIEQAATNGGEVVKPPFAESDLWIAIVRDPAGNTLGLWQRGPR